MRRYALLLGRLSKSGRLQVIVFVVLAVVALAVAGIIGFFRMHEENVIPHVTIECGETIKKSAFFKAADFDPDKAEFSLDLDMIDTKIPQDYNFEISVYNVTVPVTLTIADTLAPTCTVVPQDVFANEDIPDVTECVTDVYDIQNPISVEYLTAPDMSCTNTSIVYCKLEDMSGNINIVEVPFRIIKDDTPPVIKGAKNITAFVGDTLQYRDGIKVTDDYDDAPVLTIDNSQVDMKKAGTYTVTYTAVDAAGNMTSEEIKLTLRTKPATYVELDTLYAEADKILKQITKEGMTDMEKALKIFHWCRYNIHYIHKTDTSSWTRAAYDGFTKRQGTCYTFAMSAKALLKRAGIKTKTVKRHPYTWSRHYWNLIQIDGEWYHCDSTPRQNYHSYVFMLTDSELANFRGGGYNGYRFDHSKYPASAKKSVQDRINYSSATVK